MLPMEQHPQKYAAPPRWYSEKKKLAPYNNLMSVMQISEFTGYRSTTVTSWIRALWLVKE